jgi:hypothetical protein
MQFDVVAAKCKLTANLIARINSRNHPPSPPITASLVKYILIPQMSYAFAFWRPNKTQLRILNQIIATPLRRALGLHRSVSRQSPVGVRLSFCFCHSLALHSANRLSCLSVCSMWQLSHVSSRRGRVL